MDFRRFIGLLALFLLTAGFRSVGGPGIAGNQGANNYTAINMAGVSTAQTPSCTTGAGESTIIYYNVNTSFTVNLSNTTCSNSQKLTLEYIETGAATITYSTSAVSIIWLGNCTNVGSCTQPSLSGSGFEDQDTFKYNANGSSGATFDAYPIRNTPALATVGNGGTSCSSPTTFASLPSTPPTGTRCFITNAAACIDGVAVTTTGTAACPLVYNGANWLPEGPTTVEHWWSGLANTTVSNSAANVFPAMGSGTPVATTSEGTVANIVPNVATVKNLSCYLTTAAGTKTVAGGTNYVVAVRQNLASGALTCTIGAAASQCTDSNAAHNLTTAAQDQLDFIITPSGTPTALIPHCAVELDF